MFSLPGEIALARSFLYWLLALVRVYQGQLRVFRAHSLALVLLFEPVVVAQASAIDELLAFLGLRVVAVPGVVPLTGPGHLGQGARVFSHGQDADFFAELFGLEVIGVAP